MQSSLYTTTISPLPVPEIVSDEPVAVIPTASVAPLEGPPDGERINTFTIAAKDDGKGLEPSSRDGLGAMRDRVLGRPLTCVAAALALGWVVGRVLR